MSEYDHLGRKIRQMREAKGYSQIALAEKAMIAQSTLSYIEAGKKSPTFETLRAIGEGLGVSVAELLRLSEAEGNKTSVKSAESYRDFLTEEELKKLLEFSDFIHRKFGRTGPD